MTEGSPKRIREEKVQYPEIIAKDKVAQIIYDKAVLARVRVIEEYKEYRGARERVWDSYGNYGRNASNTAYKSAEAVFRAHLDILEEIKPLPFTKDPETNKQYRPKWQDLVSDTVKQRFPERI